MNDKNKETEAHHAAWRREEAERERAREARREWRRERKEYAEIESKKAVGDLSAVDEFAREFDDLYGPGPSRPRDPASTAPTASRTAVSGDGQWDAEPLERLHSLVGGDCDGMQILAPGPGHSPNDRSMSVAPSTQNIDGFVVHSFSPRTTDAECKAYVRFLIEYWLYDQLKDDPCTVISSPVTPYTPQAWIEAAQAIGSHSLQSQSTQAIRDKEERVASAKRQFNRALKTPIGEAVFAYLRSRGLEISDEILNRLVCYDPNGRWYEANGDCFDEKIGRPYSVSEVMILACRDVLTDEGRAIQVVRLPHIGKGPARKVKGAVENTAIKLTRHKDVLAAGEVAVAEGFESALAAMALGYKNVWACVSADNIEKFPVIDGIRKLTILAENCEANRAAREICALRWHEAGREVVFDMPEHGKDFNDDLVELTLRKAGVA